METYPLRSFPPRPLISNLANSSMSVVHHYQIYSPYRYNDRPLVSRSFASRFLYVYAYPYFGVDKGLFEVTDPGTDFEHDVVMNMEDWELVLN